MSDISLIAAIDEGNGLGINNQLFCHLPADLQHFKSKTLGKPILMGRSTFESIGKPLPGRLNLVLTRTLSFIPGALVFNSLDNALKHLEESPEIMVIGGEQLYKLTISLAKNLYITRIHHKFTADVFFPKIDASEWVCISETFRPRDDKNPYDLTFYHLQKP